MVMSIVTVIILFLISESVVNGQTPCGQTPVPPNLNTTRIVGGTAAVPYSWPWQIVWCTSGLFGICDLECGGSIIDSQFVLTAGHCVYGETNRPQQFRVKAGVYHQSSSSETGEQVVAVKAIHLHPNYQPSPVPVFDIAVIELAAPLTFTDHVQPVCLPSSDADVNMEPNKVWVTGWGTTFEGGFVTIELRQVLVPIVNTDTCQTEYPGYVQPDVMLCAGEKVKDSCQGDSGGPVVFKKNDAWFQYALTSWGRGCAEAGYAGVYSRLVAYCDFIANTTSNRVQCQ